MKVPGATITALAVSPDDKLVAFGEKKGVVRLWDMAEGKWTNAIAGPEKEIQAIAFTTDGTKLASMAQASNRDYDLRLIDLATGKVHCTFSIGYPGSVALAPDGRHVAAYDRSDGLFLWDVRTGKKQQFDQPNKDVRYKLDFSSDGKTLLATDTSAEMTNFWDVHSGQRIRKVPLPGLDPEMTELVLSPDGMVLASPNYFRDGSSLLLWDANTGQSLLKPGHQSPPNWLAFSADGKTLLSSSGGAIFRCNVGTSRLSSETPVQQLTLPQEGQEWPWVLRYSADGKRRAVAERKNMHIRDTCSGKMLQLIRDHDAKVTDIDFLPDGSALAASCDDGLVKLWNTATGRLIRVLDHRPWTKAVCWVLFAPGGKTLATGSLPLRVDLWDTATGKHLDQIEAQGKNEQDEFQHFEWVRCFSPDGKTLYTWNTKTFVVWDMVGKRRVKALHPDDGDDSENALLGSLVVSPDGRLLIRVVLTTDLQLWEAASGRMVRHFSDNEFTSAVFSPDGRTLAVGCDEDSSILLWEIRELFRLGPRVRRAVRSLGRPG